MQESNSKGFYDQNTAYRDMLEGHRFDPNWFRDFHEAVLRHSTEASVILDVGCGTGATTCYLSQFRPKIQGVDFSSLFIEEAKKTAPFFRVMDMTSLDYPDNSFDLVCSADAIEHVQGLEKSLAEMDRVLKPGGHLVLQAPNLSCSLLSTNYPRTPRQICVRGGRLLTDFWNPELKTIQKYRLETLTGDKDAFNLISPIWLRRHLKEMRYQVLSINTFAVYFQPSPPMKAAFNIMKKLPLLKETGGRLVLVARKKAS